MNAPKRTMPSITRSNGQTTYDDLADSFMQQLSKNSVQPRSQSSIYEDMYSIINGKKPKYPSVEAAVQDMLDRTGLTTYKRKLQEDTHTTKTADLQVELFQKVPQIKQTIDNYIQSTHGNMLVPEILAHIKAIHKNDVPEAGDWGSPALLTYMNETNIAEKKMHPDQATLDQDLGRVDFNDSDMDPSNLDALHCLNPAVVVPK